MGILIVHKPAEPATAAWSMTRGTIRSSYPGHSGYPREAGDLYAEPGWAVDSMLDAVRFVGPIYDPCCGTSTIVSRCRARGLVATGSDIQDLGGNRVRDVFTIQRRLANVVSNPPFILAERILRHLLPLVSRQLVLFLRLSFIEAECRDDLFTQYPPSVILAHKKRVSCPPAVLDGPRDRWGGIVQPANSGGKMPYAWWIWRAGHVGPTEIRRI
jgi:hypothetical protein